MLHPTSDLVAQDRIGKVTFLNKLVTVTLVRAWAGGHTLKTMIRR